MSILISKEKITEELKAVESLIDNGPLLLHTDLLRVGIIDKMKKRDDICFDYEQVIQNVFSNREILIPTFNYDFCRNGVYDLGESVSQVGAFTAYIANKYPHLRTRTPIFNFCIFNNNNFSRNEELNPFNVNSVFGKLHSLNGTVAFLGASFESNTFLHYVEETLLVGYRYIKVFEGDIVENGNITPIKIDYRVRPFKEHAAEYDWERIQHDLRNAGILNESQVGNGKMLWYNSGQLFDFWNAKMNNDPLYLLTDRSKLVTNELYERFGEPLSYETLEKN